MSGAIPKMRTVISATNIADKLATNARPNLVRSEYVLRLSFLSAGDALVESAGTGRLSLPAG
jgi:hypothetical protein